MIRSSFRIAPGIGPWLESRLWDAGVRRWDDLGETPPAPLGSLVWRNDIG